MLVKRLPRFKAKSSLADNVKPQPIINKGSRFTSLMEVDDKEEDTIGTNIDSHDLNLDSHKQVGLSESPKKTQRVRDPLAGKNTQPKPTKNISLPHGQKSKTAKSLNQRSPIVTSSSSDAPSHTQISGELQKQRKEKEKNILHSMKILEKQGIGTIDSFCTRVSLPSSPEVNRAFAQNGGLVDVHQLSKPPDLGASKKDNINQNASMEVDGVDTGPILEEKLGTSIQYSSKGLEDQPQKLYQ
ncbi:hypothetical protein RIF29_04937 [Crotalaria pallida]|uniref:Uncharacterized protein n=1 Tax=Crotalaria pallida TaxID=3830 RepID=A0AAN9PA31_CROPI